MSFSNNAFGSSGWHLLRMRSVMTWEKSERCVGFSPSLCPFFVTFCQEPSLTTPRLALLIDSLAAGADLFAPASGSGEAGINEMDVAMGHP